MSDIFEHKANKYKYKYLKLKKEYIGEGGVYNLAHPQFAQPQFTQPQFAHPQFAQPQFAQPQFAQPQFAQPQFAQPYGLFSNNQGQPYINTYREGGFGCVYYPLIIDFKMTQQYPQYSINLHELDKKDYVGKLMVYHEYLKELYNLIGVTNLTKSTHIPELKFAGTINDMNINSNCSKLTQFPNQKWGYIITSYVGTRIEDYPFDDKNIIIILKSLIDGINNFIKPLDKANFVHNDINTRNITVKKDKVYFIDFGLVIYNKYVPPYTDIKSLCNVLYELFFPSNFSKYNYLHNLKTPAHTLVQTLYYQSQMNNIRTPDDLIYYLEQIISSLEIATGPVGQKPVATGPVATGPVAQRPVAQRPVATGPVAQKPVAQRPVATGPVAQRPVALSSAVQKSKKCKKLLDDISKIISKEDTSVDKYNISKELIDYYINNCLE
jgi:hypothetical protein